MACAFLQQAGAQAVKLEGGRSHASQVSHLVKAGVPVMGHIGLLPQNYYQSGGYRVYGKDSSEADILIDDALALEDAGAFAVVAERIAPDVAERITDKLQIPVIGIGCETACDGYIIVATDLLGMTLGKLPAFVKPYAKLSDEVTKAFDAYVSDVRSGQYSES